MIASWCAVYVLCIFWAVGVVSSRSSVLFPVCLVGVVGILATPVLEWGLGGMVILAGSFCEERVSGTIRLYSCFFFSAIFYLWLSDRGFWSSLS